ncbi:MAG: DegQ family serine endoprotease [Methylobacteriaceae bacterium]|nr:DegQ family serine endoprotease [Methylobacteriaceae bacterium]
MALVVRHRLSRLAAVALLATGAGFGVAPSPWLAPAPALARSAPESFADLAEGVMEAVVNIAASQSVQDKRSGLPNLPQGTPFDDLFEEFFKRRQGPQGDNNNGPRTRRANSLGSGFVVDPAGIVITNNHVIADATEIHVLFTDGRKLKAELLGRDPKVDIAVLKVTSDKPLKAVKFGDSDKLRVGDWVMAVGNPFGLGGTVTAGIVSARNRNIDSGPYDNFIQTDAAINKGNSGGPLFNMAGEVVGVNTAILSPTGGSVGIGFASPAATVVPVIEQLKQFGETRRGWLGVRIQNVDDDIAASLGLGGARGALIAGVDEKGPAKPAGIEAGDVILKFNGRDIKESRDLPKIVATTPVGQEVPVVLMRKGTELTKTVKLGRLEDGEKLASVDRKSDAGKIESPVKKALGLELSALNDDARRKYSIKSSVKGVVVTQVDPASSAGEKRIQAGDVIMEVNQEAVANPADVARRVETAKSGGKKNVLLLVANAQGDTRFVAVAID